MSGLASPIFWDVPYYENRGRGIKHVCLSPNEDEVKPKAAKPPSAPRRNLFSTALGATGMYYGGASASAYTLDKVEPDERKTYMEVSFYILLGYLL